ncbi:Cytochrome b reductase 1 [Gossypium arboreum]|uniref:Cytochrome b reductase 1 n=1 Tax=Gossypium arboreum TaxID=29729 RepID=A0A0B0MW24_GOSAR|nr:Cytochrome b reductase 1 [Gossypium arboreum]KHG21676.1 Cytochrome b reductase 1 [Gossypium arboreum]
MDNRVRRGRENAPSQCSSTRRYGAEVTHAILPGKARTTFNKRVPVFSTYPPVSVSGTDTLLLKVVRAFPGSIAWVTSAP